MDVFLIWILGSFRWGENMYAKEQEVKRILSQDEYDFLKCQFDFDEEFTQINFYYADKCGIIEEKGITIRVRKKNEKIVLQVKEPVVKNGALRIHNEYEKIIKKIPCCITAKELLELCNIKLADVYLLDKLVTFRLIKWWNNTTQICLDKNQYLGVIDYEVEIEYENELEPDIIDQFTKWHISFDKKVVGKFHRFKQEYLRQKQK